MAGGRERPILRIMENQTTDGFSDEFQTNCQTKVLAYGTWDGATLTLQVNPYDGDATWIPSAIDILVETDNTHTFIDDIGPAKLRYALTGAGASTDLTIDVIQIRTADTGV